MSETADACRFVVDVDKCVGCGRCARDCVAEIIAMRDGKPTIAPEERQNGIACQHCLAVCPAGAVSVSGLSPDDSLPLKNAEYAPSALSLLMRARRSVRAFAPEPVPDRLLQKLLESAAYAPTGVNSMRRRVTVIHDPRVMDRFRRLAAGTLVEKKGSIREDLSWLVDMAERWLAGGPDELFRTAPHLILLSAPKDAPCPEQDCIIELAYFDLIAQAHGVGTVWAGIVHWIFQALPELRRPLGIPEDHEFIYAMMFGLPGVEYARTAQRKPEDVVFVRSLE